MKNLQSIENMKRNEFQDTQLAKRYDRYRTEYPEKLVQYFYKEREEAIVADIGCGTGKLTKILAKYFLEVYAIDYSESMLDICRKNCNEYANVTFIKEKAESFYFSHNHFDYIFVAQAFHYFDKSVLLIFKNILKKNGKLILIWNSKNFEDINLYNEHEIIFNRYCGEHTKSYNNIDIKSIYPYEYECMEIRNDRFLSLNEYLGFCSTASYSLKYNNDNYNLFIRDLIDLFYKYEVNGIIKMPYIIKCYYGKI